MAPLRLLNNTYILEALVVVLANVIQLVDEDVVLFVQKVDLLSDTSARELCIVGPACGGASRSFLTE